jgi:trans-aconitate 2-methyltransferase
MKDAWNVSQYEKFKVERAQPFHDLLAMVEKKPFEHAVDLGCGSGELTDLLAKRLNVKKMLGIDNSVSMLAKAKTYETPALSFQVQDLECFKEPAKYDLIFSNAAVQWCDSHGQILENIRDSLKDDGQVAIQMPMNHDYPSHVIAAEVATKAPYCDYLKTTEAGVKTRSMLKPEDYAALLYGLGFKRQQVMMKVYSHILESREAVIEWVKGTMLTYYQSKLPPEIYPQFLAEYKEALFQVLPDERPFFFPFKRLLLWASLEDR